MANRKTLTGHLNPVRRSRRTNTPQEAPRLAMQLQTLHQRIRQCRALAVQWAAKAETAETNAYRDDCLRMEKSWINLARSYEFAIDLLGKRELSTPQYFGTDALSSSSVH
jgi:hypothetical protein